MNSALLSRDRALSVLRDVSGHFEWVEDDGSTALLKRIDAIVSDVESSAAVEAYGELVAVYEEAKRFIDRTAEIDDKHPAYGFVVMGIPLAKAVAKVDARRGGSTACRNYEPMNSDGTACYVCGMSKTAHGDAP